MCTPEELRENCSCPHMLAAELKFAARIGAVAVVMAVIGIVLAAGYWWTLLIAAWMVLMGVVGVRRLGRSPQLVRRYIPAATRGSRTTTAAMPGSRPGATGRSLPPGRAPDVLFADVLPVRVRGGGG